MQRGGKRQKVHCGGNSATSKMPLSIGSRSRKRRGWRPEKATEQAGITQGMSSKTGMERVCRWMVRVSAISCSKAELLEHGGNRKQPAIGVRLVCLKVIARRSPNCMRLPNHGRNSLIDRPPRRDADLHCSSFGGLLGTGSGSPQPRVSTAVKQGSQGLPIGSCALFGCQCTDLLLACCGQRFTNGL
jgi:hypothetical protein